MTVQEKIIAEIKAAKRIIIHRHKRPDPDALGSQCGLAEAIRSSFSEKEVYQVGGPVEGLDYLAVMDEIPDEYYEDALVIVTDTANSPRISDERYDRGQKLIKIDHHPNDEPYGDLVWVNRQASSCSEMIADLIFEFPETLMVNQNGARLLYGGIVGDTGRFLYPATTSHTLEVASRLMQYGFDAAELNRQIEQVSMRVAKLSGYLYDHLQVDDHGAAFVILPQEVMEEYQIVDSETSGIVALPGVIEDVLAWGIFVQQPEGYYRVRLRSKGPIINGLAKKHHGGGHPLASGANAKDLTEVQEIYKELRELCANFKTK